MAVWYTARTMSGSTKLVIAAAVIAVLLVAAVPVSEQAAAHAALSQGVSRLASGRAHVAHRPIASMSSARSIASGSGTHACAIPSTAARTVAGAGASPVRGAVGAQLHPRHPGLAEGLSPARRAPTVRAAVEGIALACVQQPDAMLCALLIDAIGACATWASRDAGRGTPCDSAAWAAACTLTGTAAAL